MPAIFTYGSLMYPIVWQTVVAGQYASVKAELYGYERRAVEGEEYPMIIPSDKPDAVVPGVVYPDVSQADIERLDAFEGSWYDRLPLSVNAVVEHDLQEPVSVYGYVASDEGRLKVADQAWSREHFERTGLKRFRSQYMGFSVLDAE